jgi:hypothetical protein
MGIAEDLQALEELHDKGKLTDEEFSAAKASALQKKQAKPAVRPVFIILAACVAGLLGWGWYVSQSSSQPSAIATVLHTAVQLKDEVENLPANSIKSVPFVLPYSGNLTLTIGVLHGNPVDVKLVGAEQVASHPETPQTWEQVPSNPDFDAQKTQTYERTNHLQDGKYVLLLRDPTLGILSASASDISIKMRLSP